MPLSHCDIFDFEARMLVLVCKSVHLLAVAILLKNKWLRHVIAEIVFHNLAKETVAGSTPDIEGPLVIDRGRICAVACNFALPHNYLKIIIRNFQIQTQLQLEKTCQNGS